MDHLSCGSALILSLLAMPSLSRFREIPSSATMLLCSSLQDQDRLCGKEDILSDLGLHRHNFGAMVWELCIVAS